MKRSIFGVYQFDEIVGAVVLACVGVFVAVLINAGLLKDWFQPSFTLRIILPDEGVSGLAPGAEVQVLGTRAGEVRRIVIDPNGRMHAVARVEDQMRPFIRRDSQVSIRRQFGVAGAAYIDISRGTGPQLDWSYAVVSSQSERAATDTIGQMVDEVRAKIIPLMDDVQKAVVAFTAVAQRAVDPGGPLEQTLASAASIARKVESGEGVAGRGGEGGCGRGVRVWGGVRGRVGGWVRGGGEGVGGREVGRGGGWAEAWYSDAWKAKARATYG
ncbi:MAG: MCE family protein, partial [Reyranella sp.]|nr:MCE family protein [Reyranella sp.]